MRQHTARARWRRAGLPGARLLVLLAALAGLFAMHGMSDHGSMHHGAAQGHTSSTSGPAAGTASRSQHGEDGNVSGDLGSAASGVVLAAAEGSNAAVEAVAVAGDVLDSGMHAALGLCLAILAAAAALTLRRLCLRPHPLTHTLGDLGRQLLSSRARAPDPPNLYALCIQRC